MKFKFIPLLLIMIVMVNAALATSDIKRGDYEGSKIELNKAMCVEELAQAIANENDKDAYYQVKHLSEETVVLLSVTKRAVNVCGWGATPPASAVLRYTIASPTGDCDVYSNYCFRPQIGGCTFCGEWVTEWRWYCP